MLRHLRVKNFALIDEATLTFEAGLNILTGETGAGKSILMEALGFALGERLESEWLRGERTLSVEAVFEIAQSSVLSKELSRRGVSLDEGILNIKRETDGPGKTRSFLNGLGVSANQIKEIAPLLVDIFGQRESDRLYTSSYQAEVLDALAETGPDVSEFRGFYEKLGSLEAERSKLQSAVETREREMDLLKYQIHEIETVKVKHAAEDQELFDLKIRLSSAEKLGTSFREAYDALYEGEPSVLTLLGRIRRSLTNLSKVDTSAQVAELLKMTEELEVRTGEMSRELGSYGESLESDPEKLEFVMARLSEFERLKKKYGLTLEKVLQFLKDAKERLTFLESGEENLERLDQEIADLKKQMTALAQNLSAKRKKTSEKIEKILAKELETLEMKGAQFEIRLQRGEFNARGWDTVEFWLSANKGEEMRLLERVASGGEASRIELALKKCFSEAQTVDTFIFDEIDSGIGSRLGPMIGEKLETIAKRHTVIAITHLAPVASQAKCHWRALKKNEKGKSSVWFERLEGAERVKEIAAMLSGKTLTETSLKHAEEILRS